MAAPPRPPISAPRPALPVTEPIAAPVPAPSSPPDTARSPGVVPQADNARAVARTADTAESLSVAFANMDPLLFSSRSRNPNVREQRKVQACTRRLRADPIQRFLVFQALQPIEQTGHIGVR